MPKQVDHEERRQLIAAAVCRLAGRNGLQAVTLRQVAVEAGVSMGLVQHYFTTKEDMLLFAFHVMSARVEQRIGAAVASLPQPISTRSLLRALLTAMVPADEGTALEAPLWVAFLARAVVAPGLAGPLRQGGQMLRQFVVELLGAAQSAGEVPGHVDVEMEAGSLLALADGLMIHALIDPDGPTAALDTLDYHLDRIFARPPT
jgi:AcrR family transcriptional regulator